VAGRLDGEIAIVTGAARGIGASIVELFRREGAAVLATDVLDGADVRLDVTSEADWAAAVERCDASFGAPTVLVNNAGVVRLEAVEEETLEGWRAVLDVNLTGVFLGMRAVLPAMRAQRGGSIVNVSSIWGVVATEGAAAYHASKGGVTTLTKNAAVTYAADGIRVNSIHPGQVRTPMTEATGTEPLVVARTPLRRAAAPDEIATAAVYLASRESSFVTGAALVVDGGYLAQ
jgi:NAD(P)-dependent dehydrogenase (short-subunit alcohol dehydrogenase family)